jgi:hypothetical protein
MSRRGSRVIYDVRWSRVRSWGHFALLPLPFGCLRCSSTPPAADLPLLALCSAIGSAGSRSGGGGASSLTRSDRGTTQVRIDAITNYRIQQEHCPLDTSAPFAGEAVCGSGYSTVSAWRREWPRPTILERFDLPLRNQGRRLHFIRQAQVLPILFQLLCRQRPRPRITNRPQSRRSLRGRF